MHFVAPFDESFTLEVDKISKTSDSRGFWKEAWFRLRTKPVFWVTSVILFILVVLALFPGLFTSYDPMACKPSDSKLPFSPEHLLGTTNQGCDVVSRLIYGAAPSLQIGVFVTLITTFIGVIIGTIAGYVGGIVDAIISRILEIFISIPGMLSFIVVLQMLRDIDGASKLILVFSIFGWMGAARLMRSNVLAVKNQEFVMSSRALGLRGVGRMFKHVLPNSIAPVIATATMSVGTWIIVEASISFLGLGLKPGSPSWGIDISNATQLIYTAPGMLFFPCLCLVITSLTFILLGDALQDAIDPKVRR